MCLEKEMQNCEQTAGQSVYQHGVSVYEYFNRIVDGNTGDMRIPDWFNKYPILNNLHDAEIVKNYTVYHDCGKPYCRVVDVDGRVHFPNHAEVSKQTWLDAGGDSVVANLIGHDMVIHTASAKEILQHCRQWSVRDAMTLLVAALSEVHSNARLFGGISSISFKSKLKNVDRRGKQICKFYFKEI